jgi:hypothetical protein
MWSLGASTATSSPGMLECIEAVADHGSILDAQPHVVAKLARAVLLYLSPLVRRIDFAVDWVGSFLDFATTLLTPF